MTQNADQSTKALAAAVAAWESASVQNLDAVLSAAAGAALWDAIVALRSSHDVEAFARSVRTMVSTEGHHARELVERAITSVAALYASYHAAAAAAKE